MESTETLSVRVKDILVADGLVEGFRKISAQKSLRVGFARLLAQVCIGFLEGKNFGIFDHFSSLYPRAAALVIFHLLDPSVVSQNLTICKKLRERLTSFFESEKQVDSSTIEQHDSSALRDELTETLGRFRVFLRKWKLKAVFDKKTEYPRKDCDEDLFVLAQSAAKFVLSEKGNMSEYIKFLQCGTLQTLTGNVFSYEEQFKFGIKSVDSNSLSEDVIVGNTELLSVKQLHEFIASGKVKDEKNFKTLVRILEERILNGSLEDAQKIAIRSADKIVHEDDSITASLFKISIADVFRKNSNDIIDEFGIKLAALGPKRVLDYVISGILNNQSLLRLAIFLPATLYASFTRFIYEFLLEKTKNMENIKKLVGFLPVLYKNDQKGLLAAVEELSELIDFFENQWFWEIVAQNVEQIEFSEFEKLAKVILDVHENICADFMNYPFGTRSLSNSLCSKITDKNGAISIDDLSWLTTCALPRTCLPQSVFSMCSNESVDNLYPIEFDTSLPVSCLLSAVAFGVDLNLEESLTQKEEIKSAFSKAISVALVQLLPVLEKDEAKKVGDFLCRYSSNVVSPLSNSTSESAGLTGLISVISYALVLLRKDEVSLWMDKMFDENLQQNTHQLLMPIVNILKRSEDLKLFNSILKLCSDHKLSELVLPLSSTATSWKDEQARSLALEALTVSFPELDENLTPPANSVSIAVQIET